MQSATFFCSFVTKCEFSRQMYVKVTSIKFRWHLFRGCCADTWRTDGRSFWSSLRDYAKARKDRITCSRCKYSVFPNDFVNVRGEYGYCCSWLVYVVIVCVFVVLFFVCFLTLLYFKFRTAGYRSVLGRFCDRPSRHRFFLVSLCRKANAEMVPKIPSCHYMLLM